MKTTGWMTMAMLAAASVCAGEPPSEPNRAVDVCVHPGHASLDLYAARLLASKVFAQIGVRIEWHSGASCPSSASPIQISFSEQTRVTLKPNALAYALPYEGTHIVVFYDRIKEKNRKAGAPQLLAYVMVHEITHILQAVDRHSLTGLMKAQWSGEDYFEMARQRLGFTPVDVDLIYRGLDGRGARRAGATLMASR